MWVTLDEFCELYPHAATAARAKFRSVATRRTNAAGATEVPETALKFACAVTSAETRVTDQRVSDRKPFFGDALAKFEERGHTVEYWQQRQAIHERRHASLANRG